MDEFLNQKMENCEILAIPEYDGYYVSVDGDVYSEKKGIWKKLKPQCGKDKYCRVVLYKNNFFCMKKVHRLIAETFLYNPENKKFVDHINRKRFDNRLCNLRWVSRSENGKNCSKAKNNTSGVTGVCFNKRDNRWVAYWNDDNNKRFKYFPVKKYGDEKAKKLAIEHREKMEKLYYPTLTKI